MRHKVLLIVAVLAVFAAGFTTGFVVPHQRRLYPAAATDLHNPDLLARSILRKWRRTISSAVCAQATSTDKNTFVCDVTYREKDGFGHTQVDSYYIIVNDAGTKWVVDESR